MFAVAFLLVADPLGWFRPEEVERLFFRETNRARAEEGLDTLSYDSLLSVAARSHSEEMATLNYQSHTSPVKKNRTLEMRLANAGFDTTGAYSAAENIAKIWRYSGRDYNFSGPAEYFFYEGLAEEAVEGLLNSPGHRKNMLSRDYTRIGVGVALRQDGNDLWIYFTQVFWGE